MGTTETFSSLNLFDDNVYNCIPDETYQYIEALPTTNISTKEKNVIINLETIKISWSVTLKTFVRALFT